MIGCFSEASAVTVYTWNSSTGHLARTQTFTYQIPAPGPVPDRQNASHPHGVMVDPTGRFVLVPDLGMDRIHIFKISPSTGHLQPQAPLLVKPGSGPRHAVFWTPSSKAVSIDDTVMYLVSELGNTLSAFKPRYTRNGLSFTKVFEENIHGGEAAPDGSKASGIQITVRSTSCAVSPSMSKKSERTVSNNQRFSSLEMTILWYQTAVMLLLASKLTLLPSSNVLPCTEMVPRMSHLSACFLHTGPSPENLILMATMETLL